MLTTNILFERVISKTNWYEPLGFSKQYASNLKKKFFDKKLSEIKQEEILLKLGYEVEQPMIWKENIG